MKSVKMFGKSVPLLAIVLVGMLTIGASAALLTQYGVLTATATVKQSVLLDGANPGVTDAFTTFGGNTVCREHYIINQASVDAKVQLVSTNSGAGGDISVSYCNTLRLEDKNPTTWALLDTDKIYADVKYTVVGEKFNYTIDAYGLTPSTEYMLIYYADQQVRFVNWGGDPAKKLGIFTSDLIGQIHESKSKNTGDMPFKGDWNDNPDPSYKGLVNTYDDYDHGSGAKLWLIPSVDWKDGIADPGGKLIAWNPTTYLFETDMIRYFDNTENKLIIPAGEYLRFDFCYTFDIALVPTDYTITTQVNPSS